MKRLMACSYRVCRLIIIGLLSIVFADTGEAQTGGPVQSDYTGSPAPVGPSVDEFTGQFSFGLPLITVPGPHGSGYTVSLSYRSGASPNDVPSWVGYGWNLNAGAVIRDTRGFPDDWKDTVVYWNKGPEVYTATAVLKGNVEILSAEYSKTLDSYGMLGFNTYNIFNSHKGFSRSYSLTGTMEGVGTQRYAWGGEDEGFSGSFDPRILSFGADLVGKGKEWGEWADALGRIGTNIANGAMFSFGSKVRSMDMQPFIGESENVDVGVTVSLPAYLSGITVGITGKMTTHRGIDKRAVPAYGYMYSRDAITTSVGTLDRWLSVNGEVSARGAMDYYRERTDPYRNGNAFLPIPFSNADMFMLTGGAGSGGMRLVSNTTAHFFPESTTSRTPIKQVGFEVEAGGRLGIGANYGLGEGVFKTTGWWYQGMGYSHHFPPAEAANQSFFMKMQNDRGGRTSFAASDDPVQASFNTVLSPYWSFVPILGQFVNPIEAVVAPDIRSTPLWVGERGRSLFVDFHTISDWKLKTDNDVHFRSYNKDVRSRSFIDTADPAIQGSIAEIAVTDGGGSRYVYGLPVFARDEKEIEFGLDQSAVGLPPLTIEHNLRAYCAVNAGNSPSVFGEERKAPYATGYLLTEITTPNYIDVDNNGPSNDDIGGWTKFNYRRTAGSDRKSSSSGVGLDDRPWYAWRFPIDGLLYRKGSLSDARDDIGHFSSGRREIYYLESIETATHIAVFVTNETDKDFGARHIEGSKLERRDGYPTMAEESVQPSELEKTEAGTPVEEASESQVRRHLHPLEKLERIELYTRDSEGNPDSLLLTVYMEHDYSLRHNMPNSLPGDEEENEGLLTLRKVWFQPQGLAPSRIQPYIFGYDYRKSSDYPQTARERYAPITSFADSLSDVEQNPDYNFFDLDRWGSYQLNGADRYAVMNPWVKQLPQGNEFDPAAWQLKWYRIPAGGEQHIQYEQNEYSYVQDRPAMSMVSLVDSVYITAVWHKSYDLEGSNRYYLNLSDLGIADTDSAAIFKTRDFIENAYVKNKSNKMYFKFLYALRGNTAGIENSEKTSEYITGYVSVSDVTISQIGSSPARYIIEVNLKSESGSGQVPKTICREYVEKERWGLLENEDMIERSSAETMASDIIGTFAFSAFHPEQHCLDIDYPNSYLRIPMVKPKKGGGVRVKRLLTLDPGNEGDSALYGTEYMYEVYDEDRRETIGSGVAANEPVTGREENALVDFRPVHEKPELNSRSIYGNDRERYESIPGESILPAASVGYSRIVARSIHTGKTNPGFSVSEFFTTKDYPFVKVYTDDVSDHTPVKVKNVESPPSGRGSSQSFGDDAEATIKIGTVHMSDKTYLSQGYRFVRNEMNGRPRKRTAYGGNYLDPSSWYTSSSTGYTYFEPGEPVPMMEKVGDSMHYDTPGKDMEVVMESRATLENIMDLNIQADASVSSFALVDLQFTGAAQGMMSNSELYTHVTTKVVSYPAIVKSVSSYTDGVYHLNENIAFSKATGAPILTKTHDAYDALSLQHSGGPQKGAYHSYAFPAWREHHELGQKAATARTLLKSSGSTTIKITYGATDYLKFSGAAACNSLSLLTRGDLIRLTKKSDGAPAGFYHIGSVEGDSVALLPVASDYATPVVGTSLQEVDLEVLESGRRNDLGAGVGSITTYGENTTDILNGTNVYSWEPAEMATRRLFADLLNDKLEVGGGLIYPAEVQALGLDFIDPTTSECDSLQDVIRVELKDNSVILTRGEFTITDTVCGTPLDPHDMVPWLNAYLNGIWGYGIPSTHESALNECNNPDLWRHQYTERPAGYLTKQIDFLGKLFECVNGNKDARLLSTYLQIGALDDLDAGFRTDSNALYGATGPFYLEGMGVTPDFLSAGAVADCSGGLSQMRLRRQWRFGANIGDNTTNYNTPDAADFNSIYPYTTYIGRFEQDSSGYLNFHDLFGSSTPWRAFGIRFHRLDTIAQSTYCRQISLTSGGAGRFEIDKYGRLTYVCEDGACPPRLISCLEFCPEPELYGADTLRGVIAAAAAVISDADPYKPADWPVSTADRNEYELGERGHWSTRTGYMYRTPVTGGGATSSGERVYRKAGVYTRFTLFDWQNPDANDATYWIRLDTVTRYSPYGHSLESKDRAGIFSSVRYDGSWQQLMSVALNAEYESAAFSDFENPESVPTRYAHSGKRAVVATPNGGSDDFTIGAHLTQTLKSNNVLIRFWGKGMGDGQDVQISVWPESQPSENVILGITRIAQTGEWTLYEAMSGGFTGMTPVGDPLFFLFTNDTDDSVYIDDLKIQPAEAEMLCYSYDTDTRRHLATFDLDHFGTYQQYNAEGRVVRTIIETSKGLKTVADLYAHTPSEPRTGGEPFSRKEKTPPAGIRSQRGGNTMSAEDVAPLLSGSRIDMLGIELAPDRRDMSVLGKNIGDLSDLSLPSADSLSAPALHYGAMFKELDSLDIQFRQLSGIPRDSLSHGERVQLDKQVRELRSIRRKILRRFNVREAELEDLRRLIGTSGDIKSAEE